MNPFSNRTLSDRTFDMFNVLLFATILLIAMYPLYFMIIASFSDPTFVNTGQVWIWPKGITFEGYERILAHDALWIGYKNSLLYAVVGTAINVIVTISGGYALSRREVIGRNLMTKLIIFTMFFQGGLIPTYILVRDLGMLNTMWALIIPTAVTVFQLIIVRTFFQSTIPSELLESAKVDGCRDLLFFIRIVVPLSLPIIAVIVLFNAVNHWNSYFPALIYIRDEDLQPLQIVLRSILIQSQVNELLGDPTDIAEQQRIAELIKFGIIIIASLPVLVLYPFLQKYFVKGMMIGSIKG